ncbi:hypothetical protein CDCA_CDCA05G1655 [Cyanidium caldarium]|uniref:Nucleolar 27S pre-rRNA processing Urb2/Npa2 C-terminal domain-containing protein n=1 Tax=Cyanidium caldarium TaxID=2771 RepID=A0AAV9IU47_CYACA|nr:hypothetical protein CDCA_CDCA05G1655 [Cyanidium caldarium]
MDVPAHFTEVQRLASRRDTPLERRLACLRCMASRKPHEGVAWFIPAAEREALQLVLDVLRDLLDGRRLPSRQDDGEDSGAVRSGQHYLSFMRLLEQLLRQLGDAHGVALPRSLVPVLAAGMEGRLPPSVTDQMAVDRREQDEQDEPTVPVAAALHLERDAPVSLPLAQELQLVALRVMRRCLCSYTFQPTHLDLLQLLRAVLLPRRAFAAADPETRWHGERSAGVDALCTRWAAHKELLAADAQRVHELFGGADGLFVALAALQPRDASVDRVLRSVVDRLYEAAGAASSRTEGETGRSLAALLWEMLGLGPAASNRERPPGNGELSAPDQRNPHPPRGAANAAAAAAAAAISTAFILGAERLAPPELLTAEETGTAGAVALKRPRRAVDAAAEPRDRASMRAFLVACLDSMTAMPPLSTDAETALWETVLRAADRLRMYSRLDAAAADEETVIEALKRVVFHVGRLPLSARLVARLSVQPLLDERIMRRVFGGERGMASASLEFRTSLLQEVFVAREGATLVKFLCGIAASDAHGWLQWHADCDRAVARGVSMLAPAEAVRTLQTAVRSAMDANARAPASTGGEKLLWRLLVLCAENLPRECVASEAKHLESVAESLQQLGQRLREQADVTAAAAVCRAHWALTAFVTSVGSSAPRPPPDIATIPDGVFEDALMARWHAVRAGCAHERTALDRLSLDERGSGEAGAGFTVAALRLADSNGDERVLRLAIQQAVRDAASRQLFLEDADVWDIAVRAEPKSNDDAEDTEVLCPVWHTADVLVRCAAVADTTALCSRPWLQLLAHMPAVTGASREVGAQLLARLLRNSRSMTGEPSCLPDGMRAMLRLASLVARKRERFRALYSDAIEVALQAAMEMSVAVESERFWQAYPGWVQLVVRLAGPELLTTMWQRWTRERREWRSLRRRLRYDPVLATCMAAVVAPLPGGLLAGQPSGRHSLRRWLRHVGKRALQDATSRNDILCCRPRLLSAWASMCAAVDGRQAERCVTMQLHACAARVPAVALDDATTIAWEQLRPRPSPRATRAAGLTLASLMEALIRSRSALAMQQAQKWIECMVSSAPSWMVRAIWQLLEVELGRASASTIHSVLPALLYFVVTVAAAAAAGKTRDSAWVEARLAERLQTHSRRDTVWVLQLFRHAAAMTVTMRNDDDDDDDDAGATASIPADHALCRLVEVLRRLVERRQLRRRALLAQLLTGVAEHTLPITVHPSCQLIAAAAQLATVCSRARVDGTGALCHPLLALAHRLTARYPDHPAVRRLMYALLHNQEATLRPVVHLLLPDYVQWIGQVRQRVAALADAPPEVVAVRGRAERCLRFILFELYALGDEAQAEYAVAVLGGPWKALARQLHRDYLRFHQYSGIA